MVNAVLAGLVIAALGKFNEFRLSYYICKFRVKSGSLDSVSGLYVWTMTLDSDLVLGFWFAGLAC